MGISQEEDKVTVSKKTFEKLKEFHEQHQHVKEKLTLGQKVADIATGFCGSWTFIIIFTLVMIFWVIVNLYLWSLYFAAAPPDPYPFILLNLFLSGVAALQAPIILMSQNRLMQRDRAKAERDYYVNRKAEQEIEDVQRDLHEIKQLIKNLK